MFLNPLVRRSWAPRGRTPVIRGDGWRHHKVSAIGAVTMTVSPRTRRLGLYFANRIDGYFGAGEVVAFLRNLLWSISEKIQKMAPCYRVYMVGQDAVVDSGDSLIININVRIG